MKRLIQGINSVRSGLIAAATLLYMGLAATVSAQCTIVVMQEPTLLNCKMPTTQICIGTLPGSTYSWTTADGNISGATNGTCITATEPGTYTVTVTNAAEQCTNTRDFVVEEENCHPTCEILMPDDGAVLECDSSGNVAVVDAQADPCGVWEIVWRFVQPVPAGWYIEDGVNDPTMTYHVGGHGTTAILQVEVVAMSGCKTFCEVELTAECPTPPEQCPIVVTQSPNPLNCKMPTTQICIEDVPGATISWSTTDGTIIGSSTGPCITAGAVGTYTVTVTDPVEQCTTSTDIEVVDDGCVPTCEIIFPDDGATVPCNTAGLTATVVAEAIPCGVWEINWRIVPNGIGWFITDGQHEETMTYTSGDNGTTVDLVVEVVAMNGCKTECRVTVTADCPPPDEQCPIIVTQAPNPLSCKMPTTQICIDPVENAMISWDTEDGHIVGSSNTECITVDEPGIYTVTVTNPDADCETSMDIEVVNDDCEPTCEITSPEDGAIVPCNTAGLTATVIAEAIPCGVWEINWHIVPNGIGWFITDGQHEETMTYTSGDSGTSVDLVVEVIAMNGCKTECRVTVTADCPPPPPQCPIIVTQEPNPLSCKMPTTQICIEEVPGATITWTTTDGQIIGPANGACITAGEAGIYTVTVTNEAEECTTAQDIEVVDDDCVPTCEIIFPDDGALVPCNTAGLTATVVAEAIPCGVWEINWHIVPNGIGWFITDGQHEETMTYTSGDSGTSVDLVVEVIAMNGCKTECRVTVTADCPPPDEQCPIVITQQPNPLSCKMPTTQICIEEVPGATITWTTTDGEIIGPADGACITAGKAGIYTVTVANEVEECTTSQDIEVIDDDCVPTCEITSPEDGATVPCNTAGLTATVEASAEPCGIWEINWHIVPNGIGWFITDGQHEKTVTYTSGDTGTSVTLVVEVIAMNGCKTECSVVVNADCPPPPPPACPILSVGTPDVITCNDSTVEVCVTSDILDVTYQWTTENGIIDGPTDGACITAAKAGDYTVVVTTNEDEPCSDTMTVTVLSDEDVPMCDILEPTEAPEPGSAGNQLSVVATDAVLFSWTVDNPDYVITLGADTDTVTYTAGPAGSSAIFTCTVFGENGCDSICQIVVSVPDDELPVFCSFTQGFWGNKNGLAVMTALLENETLVLGKPGRSITISGADGAKCLNELLPAGGKPGPLGDDLGDVVLNGDSCELTAASELRKNPQAKGKGVGLMLKADRRNEGKNVLLGQTAALSLNVLLNPELCDIELCDQLITRKVKVVNGELVIDENSGQLNKAIPKAVQDALVNLGLPNTPCGLLELANRALAGEANLGGANYSQINDAATTINEVFDECRVLIECRDVVNR